VIRHFVTTGLDGRDDLAVGTGPVADEEEGGVSIVLGQQT
jgi:hypothetical protein